MTAATQRRPLSLAHGSVLSRHGWFVLGALLIAGLVAYWRSTQYYPTALNDLYPLYYGAKAWLLGSGAYDLTAVVPPSHHPYPLYQIGNIYPLPAVLLVLPLTLLPPTWAAMAWLAILVVGLLGALRLNGWSPWLILYVPVLNAIYAEQYTLCILVLQLFAIWAWRAQRPWLLALCCALILTKPNQGLIFILALVLLSRQWRHCLAVGAAIWGGSLLLDPDWLGAWLPTLGHHHELTQQPILWGLALFALPLLLVRDYLGATVMLQYLIMPYPHAAYPFSTAPLGVLDFPGYRWLIPLSYLWIPLHFAVGEVWATVLALILPVVALSLFYRRDALPLPPAIRNRLSAKWRAQGTRQASLPANTPNATSPATLHEEVGS